MRVGYLPGSGFIINPSAAQMAQSSLDLLMAGTSEAVLMIEGFCDWLTEDQMLEVRLLLCCLVMLSQKCYWHVCVAEVVDGGHCTGNADC